MTMVYTADGLLYTKVPFNDLVAMNKTSATVDLLVWEFTGTSERAAQRRAIFNSWFLSCITGKFKEPDYPGRYEPESRYRVLSPELEGLVLEKMEDDGSYQGCPGPDQDCVNPDEVVFNWGSWILYRLFRHSYIEAGFDDEWDNLDREADAEERGCTQAAQRRDAELAYRDYLAHRPPMARQSLLLTAKPATIRQLMDFIVLMNSSLDDRDDRIQFAAVDTTEEIAAEEPYAM